MPSVDFWILISSLAERDVLMAVSLVLILYFLYKKEPKNAFLIAVIFYGGIILNKILKEIFQVPRPTAALIPVDGYSFPSGHAMSAVIFYSLLVIIFYKKIENNILKNSFVAVNILIIFLVGLSRIMLKVHSIYDVISGYVFGLLWLFIVYRVLEKTNLQGSLLH